MQYIFHPLLRYFSTPGKHTGKVSKKYLLSFILIFLAGIPNFNPEGSRFSNFQNQSMASNAAASAFYSEEEIEFIDYQITKVLTESKFNGTVLIARYGMLVYEKAFGFAHFTRAEPLNMETSFQLASISKTFTAAAVLLLQQQGLLHISDRVDKHIAGFPYNNITIQQLLNHTSGLQNYMWLVERRWTRSTFPNNEDILKLFVDNKRNLNFTPGSRFEYSNTGYVFLGLLIERVSGKSFSEFIHENIFTPLEMDRSFVYDLHNPREIENRAYGFQQARGRYNIIPDDKLDGPLGDKGIFSSAGDLYKWDQAILRSALLPSEIWQKAFTHGRLNNDSTIQYGLGWRLQNYLDKQIVHHPGRWHGFRTSFKRFSGDHTTMIILSNNNQNIVGLIEKIQDIIYYDDKEIWMANQTGEFFIEDTEEPEHSLMEN
jgi:CubicO group peptidase (beta-lactamase class C family)